MTLQQAFSKSPLLRTAILNYYRATGWRMGTGYKRTWYKIIGDTFDSMPEAEIKRFLYLFLQCSDITAANRAEIAQLLSLSQTALTENQRERLRQTLQEW